MEILYVLFVLLVVTRVFGELALRAGQPPLVGELLAGIGLGILVGHFSGAFPILSELTHNEVFIALTDLGIFFIMLLGGIEMSPKKLVEASGSSFIISVSAMVLPLAAGFAIGWAFLPDSGYKVAQALFVGTALAITAVPVAVRVLIDLGRLNTRAGQLIISAAVIDDVLSLILLAVLTGVIETGGFPDAGGILMLFVQALAFFAITGLFGRYVFSWLGDRIKSLRLDELDLSFMLVVALLFSLLAELLQLHFILGTFVAGLFFGRQTIDPEKFESVKSKVAGISSGFLAPVFFASIGLHLDLRAAVVIPGFLILLVAVAFASKLIGAALPARLLGWPTRTAIAVGVAMSSRGAVELVIADIANRAGLFEAGSESPVVANMFSAIVVVAIVTTLLVPVGLRFVLGRRGERSTAEDEL